MVYFGVFEGNLKVQEYGIPVDQFGQIISLLVTAIIMGFIISVISGISYVVAKKRRKVTRHKDDEYESYSKSNSMETESSMVNEKMSVMDEEMDTDEMVPAINEKHSINEKT